MPSGAKKRKAAKKKKENQSSNLSNPSPASTQSQGDEDVKPPEDKESDAGEVGSPASEDHHTPPLQESKIEGGEKNVVEEKNALEVERELKIEGGSEKNHGPVERNDDGGSSGSSSSESSDDEKNSKAAEDPAPVVDSVKKSGSSSGKSSEAIHIAPINENGEGRPSSAEDKVGPMASMSAAEREEKEIVQSVQIIDTNPNECVTQENDNLALSHNAPTPTGVEHETNSGVTEQPVLMPSQAPVQRTSWKSCCGLFEALTGPNT